MRNTPLTKRLNIGDTMAETVDPLTHLALPMLVLLAAGQDKRLVIPLAFFAILPDFDSFLTPHRVVLHNMFIVIILPLAFILIAKLRKPRFVLPGMLVLFYLSSHILLDLDGVAFFYPLSTSAFQIIPIFELHTAPGISFTFYFKWGEIPLPQVTDYNLLSSMSIALFVFFLLLGYVYRTEVRSWLRKTASRAKSMIGLSDDGGLKKS